MLHHVTHDTSFSLRAALSCGGNVSPSDHRFVASLLALFADIYCTTSVPLLILGDFCMMGYFSLFTLIPISKPWRTEIPKMPRGDHYRFASGKREQYTLERLDRMKGLGGGVVSFNVCSVGYTRIW